MDNRFFATYAPAKLNLFLELLGKRGDGYHELETVMSPVSLCDYISVRPNTESGLKLSLLLIGLGKSPHTVPQIPTDERNLAVKAWRAIELIAKAHSEIDAGVSIEIHKRIPTEAGLGGASSNAAAALQLANVYYNLKLSTTQLSEIAARLGSDVPFFLQGGSGLCRGRGEVVTPLRCGGNLWFVILKPQQGFSTSEVYRHAVLAAQAEPVQPMLKAWRSGDVRLIGRSMFNRLQQAAHVLGDWVDRARFEFSRVQCHGHQLSGSGSSYFGLFARRIQAMRAAKLLQGRLPQVDCYVCTALNRLSNLNSKKRIAASMYG
ncbi:MAG TPA: 4-(cytidine 5'-diphospho)-2-C-methyl-D-erythritol kinase [Pirellulaceae bacterium]|nr:4-(cytidine 5'-diphospho)-2-C-methyl-D-erythritol kinase [Pirellulaceae bacterium]HMO91558.1 4-(cytidine 5'-diphospho)-2-C-methyl-D-erythritol kinase [Pirellulaceae bacterium]HMP68255.1 4-(cytidine 5'-diphospho)-2-C-methyl-D-erythritol kinase [Pirellulaceae bacterium]